MSTHPNKRRERTRLQPEIEWRPISLSGDEGGVIPGEAPVIQLTLTAYPRPRLIVESAKEDDLRSLQYREQRTGELLVWYRCRQCGAMALLNLLRETRGQLCVYHELDCPG